MKRIIGFMMVAFVTSCSAVDSSEDVPVVPEDTSVSDFSEPAFGTISGDLGSIESFGTNTYRVDHDSNDHYESFTNYGMLPNRVVMSKISFILIRPEELSRDVKYTFSDGEVSVAACYGYQEGSWSYDQNSWSSVDVEISSDGVVSYSTTFSYANDISDFVVGAFTMDQ